ncbi:uncharacterized protein N7479_010291 [Penicillium vulpinum]|uniref:Rhodopsin domain-containing protein n=1 Tax=Penicillium vulpinum TaxID=29845 RepID=A0A1V6S9C3_9EURO|nr:uncharacterized protein N7479_010291 [Penicillium vulpinum]KAJ5951878.1 hypothetical protein N7479_010291 [Penicillium vulpinum]OQE10339.1 hypothetical protein PENVUL_c004G03318 [Penicillium vulpinum]
METFLQPRSEVENRGPVLLIVNGTVTGIAAIIVGLRAISRIFIVKKFGLDDWTMVAAMIFAIGNVVVAGFGVKYGTGKHKWDLDEADVLPTAKLRYVTHIIYTVITGLTKVSICLLYLRLFPNIRIISLGTIAFVTAMSIAFVFATIFQCSPVDAIFDEKKYKHYSCFDSIPFWYATAALSLATDIWILLLPLKTVLELHLRTRKRLIIASLLSLGAFACIASIMRMVYIVKLYKSPDPSWDTFGVSVCSGIEVAVAITAASIPAIKPIVNRLFPRLFPSSAGVSQSASHQVYPSGSRIESARRRFQPRDIIPLSLFTMKEGSDTGDDESTKAIRHAN